MRPVSWRGLSPTEPCFVSVCIPNRLATSYRLALDFRPLCDNLLAALNAARSASMSYSAARSFTRPATSEFVVVRAKARIWAARSRQCCGSLVLSYGIATWITRCPSGSSTYAPLCVARSAARFPQVRSKERRCHRDQSYCELDCLRSSGQPFPVRPGAGPLVFEIFGDVIH